MSNKRKLKPCPFCGGKATFQPMFVQSKDGDRAIRCMKCLIEIVFLSHKQAVESWNKRIQKKKVKRKKREIYGYIPGIRTPRSSDAEDAREASCG